MKPGFIKVLIYIGIIGQAQLLTAEERSLPISIGSIPPAGLSLIFLTASLVIILYSSQRTKSTVKKRLARLLNNSNDIILICDTDGNVKECVAGMFWDDSLLSFFEQENHWELVQSLKTVAALDQNQLIRLNLTSSEMEQEKYFQLVLQNLMNIRGIRGISVTITDVSSSKQLEKPSDQVKRSSQS